MRLHLKFGLIALLLAAGCAGREQTTPAALPQPAPAPPAAAALPPEPFVPIRTGPAKVGLLVPMTGPGAALGADLVDAAQLALFDVGATDLELLPRDTGDDPAKAERAAQSALAAGAELLLGPLYSGSTQAIAPLAAAAGVSVISFSNDASVGRPGVYVLGFRPEEQVERVVRHAAALGRARFAAIAPADAYGARVMAALRTAVARVPGATTEIAVTFPPDSTEPRAEVRQIAAHGRPGGLPPEPLPAEPGVEPLPPPPPPLLPPPGFDVLLIGDGGERVSTIAAMLAYYDISPATVTVLGNLRWQEDAALLADPGLQGSLLATWPPDEIAQFEQRFAQIYGRRPASLAVLAYDATALAVLLARNQPRFTRSQISDPQGFFGGGGIFRLLPDGLAEHGLAVVVIEGGRIQVVDPAPGAFAAEVLSQ